MHCRLFEVEALCEVSDGGGGDHGEREVPGALLAAREAAREPDQAEAEREREGARGVGHAGWQHAADEVEAIGRLRRQR